VYVGGYNSNVLALNGTTGQLQWSFSGSANFPFSAAPTLGPDGTVYIGNWGGNFYAINPDGTLKWMAACVQEINSAAVVGPFGHVFVGAGNGVNAFDATSGTPIWTFTSNSTVASAPALGLGGTVLYVGSYDFNMYAVHTATGHMLWKAPLGGEVSASAAIGADGTVYVGTWKNNFFALNGLTGSVTWKLNSIGGFASGASISTSGLVYISTSGTMYAVHGATGASVWTAPDCGSPVSAAVDANGIVYGASDNYVCAVDGTTGDLQWMFQTGASVLSSPAIGAQGTLYIGSNDHNLYALK
jgi:outer membrane protein assembly factor BamB